MGIFAKDKKTKSVTGSKTKAKVEVAESATRSPSKHGLSFRVLVRPLLSEKTARAEARGTYTFAVAMDANKTEITQAVEAVYGVRPTQVRTSLVEGKATRSGRRANWKKAVVTLPAGKTISIHTGV